MTSLLVPVFFVLMGMRVDLRVLAHQEILGLAALITAAAVIGKQVCALGGLGAPLDRLSIGIGMIPQGEVGLIFANLGLGLTIHGTAVVDATLFSTMVVMVMATTLATSPLLSEWSFRPSPRQPAPARACHRPRGGRSARLRGGAAHRDATPYTVSCTFRTPHGTDRLILGKKAFRKAYSRAIVASFP